MAKTKRNRRGADSFQINELMEQNALFTRREMLTMAGLAGISALAGNAAAAFPQTQQKRPRIAVLASYWAFPRSHADWIVNKLLDGYWWDGAYTPSRVEVVSVYIHQLEESQLGQKVAKAKNIPVFKTVGEAVTLGGKELAVDGVVIVAEHGNYPTDLRGTGCCHAGGFISRLSAFSSRASDRCRSLTTSTCLTIGTMPSGCLINHVSSTFHSPVGLPYLFTSASPR